MDDSSPQKNNELRALYEEYFYYITQLQEFGKSLSKEPHRALRRLCREVPLITKGHAQLLLYPRDLWGSTTILEHEKAASSPDSYPVQKDARCYGILQITTSSMQDKLQELPLQRDIARSLATTCSFILHDLEMSVLVQERCKQIAPYPQKSLTRREYEILTLLGQGHSQEEIAQGLAVSLTTLRTHKRSIYSKLDVENEGDARLVGHCMGLISLFEDVDSRYLLQQDKKTKNFFQPPNF